MSFRTGCVCYPSVMKPRSSLGAHTLPRKYYTAQDIYDLESERIFNRRWLCVGLAAALSEPGSYFLADLEGESLVIVKESKDRIRAFHNVCRHRGTQLCSETTGAFTRHIVCPYHSWAYDLTGTLVGAPNMADVEGFETSRYPLHEVAIALWEGLIFINLNPEPQPFEEAFAPILTKFESWNLPDLVPVHRTEYEVEANWKLLVQNYSECYHCPTLHPALNKLTPYRDSGNDLEEGPILGGPMRLSKGSSSMTIDGRACAAPFRHLAGEDLRLVHYYVMFPSMFLSIMPDYAMIHRLVRKGPTRSTVICEWLFHPEAEHQPNYNPTGAVEFWDMTNRQDWWVCEQSQKGINSRVYGPGPYADLESMLAAIDREYLAAMGHATPESAL